MKVTFDIQQFPGLVQAAQEILYLAAGKSKSVDFKMIQSAICDLERIERIAEEVNPAFQLEAA